jgi:hypothetical protein
MLLLLFFLWPAGTSPCGSSQNKASLLKPGATPSTPEALPNFLESVVVPYRFRSVGGVGGTGHDTFYPGRG